MTPAPKCAVPGCKVLISPSSRTGVCREHTHHKPHCRCQQCREAEERARAWTEEHGVRA